MPSLPRPRTVAVALLAGVVNLAVTVSLDRSQGYPISAFGSGPVEWLGFGLGVVVLAGVPVFLLLRYGLVSPPAATLVVVGTFLVPAVTGPAPEFSELGGHTIVAGTLHLRNYVQGWYCWLLVAVLAGLVEYAARTDVTRLPSVRRRLAALDRRDRATALRVAAVVGVVHLAAVVALAAEWRYFAPVSSVRSPARARVDAAGRSRACGDAGVPARAVPTARPARGVLLLLLPRRSGDVPAHAGRLAAGVSGRVAGVRRRCARGRRTGSARPATRRSVSGPTTVDVNREIPAQECESLTNRDGCPKRF